MLLVMNTPIVDNGSYGKPKDPEDAKVVGPNSVGREGRTAG